MKQQGIREKYLVKVSGERPQTTIKLLEEYIQRSSLNIADYDLAQICEPAEVADFQLRIFGKKFSNPDIWISGLSCGQKATLECLSMFGFKLLKEDAKEILTSTKLSKYYIKHETGFATTRTI